MVEYIAVVDDRIHSGRRWSYTSRSSMVEYIVFVAGRINRDRRWLNTSRSSMVECVAVADGDMFTNIGKKLTNGCSPYVGNTSCRQHGRIYHCSLGGGSNFVCPLGVVVTWHRAVECLVSGRNRVIYILPLMLSYKYDDIVVSCCDKQHFHVLFLVSSPPPPTPHPRLNIPMVCRVLFLTTTDGNRQRNERTVSLDVVRDSV